MAGKIRKGAMSPYLKMLSIWSVLLLVIVGIFLSKDVLAADMVNPDVYGIDRRGVFEHNARQWSGFSTNRAYQNDVYQLIKDKDCLQKEWLKLGIGSFVPQIDFNKNIVVEIVKKNSSGELTLKETLIKESEGRAGNKVIVFNYYIESASLSDNLAYLFVVTAKSDSPITMQEQRYYDGTYIAKDYVYNPIECAYNTVADGNMPGRISQSVVETPIIYTYFADNFDDSDFTNNPRWYYKENNSNIITGIEGDTHNSSLKWDVSGGYLWFSTGDFTGLDLASDDINIPFGLDKLVIEVDTFLGGTWANHNLITLEDQKGNVVFGGGIYCDGYAYMKGNHKTNNGLLLIGSAESDKKELPDDSLNPYTWKHVRIIFDKGNITIDCDYGEFSFTQRAKFTVLPEIKKIRIGGWQHIKGAKFDNIVVGK